MHDCHEPVSWQPWFERLQDEDMLAKLASELVQCALPDELIEMTRVSFQKAFISVPNGNRLNRNQSARIKFEVIAHKLTRYRGRGRSATGPTTNGLRITTRRAGWRPFAGPGWLAIIGRRESIYLRALNPAAYLP